MIEYKGKQVTIMSCSNCNANCEHCYISYKGNFDGKELLNMCKNFKNRYKIIINGTEVLLHDDYFDALKISDQNRILTNGIVIYNNPKILDKIKETGIKKIAMSYHFESDVSSVPKKIVEKCIELIQNAGLTAELMCTITKDNYNKLSTILSQAKKLGVKTVRLFNCLNTGNCENMHDICLSEKDIDIFFKELNEERQKYSKEELIIKRNGAFGNDINNKNCHFKCIAGVDEVVITPSLDVYPCIFMAKKGYEIGKYVNGKIMLFNEIKNNGKKCIAYEVFNKQNNEIVRDVF